MKVLAFLYDNYDDVGVRNNFRGIWDSKEKALETLKGGRFALNNLELLDLETFGWSQYIWEPTYILRSGEWIKHPWNKDEFDIQRKFLKYRWGGKDAKEIEIFPPSNYNASEFGPEHDALYEAGCWKPV